jgi:hypothetical protein
VPPAPCVTAASEDKNNRSCHEVRSLRCVAAQAESLCCAHVRSVVEITRQTTPLRVKDKGKTSVDRVVCLCSLEPDESRADELLGRVRRYWNIEGGLHQRLDVSGGEDPSRVCIRNGILVLGILRRCASDVYLSWRRTRKNPRQSTFKDFHDAMNRFNHRLAFATITSPGT